MKGIRTSRTGPTRIRTATPLLLLLAGCAARQNSVTDAQSDVRPWATSEHTGREIVTEHFRVFSTLRDTELERALPNILESCYRRYQSILPEAAQSESRLTTFLFDSRAEWLAFTQSRFPSQYGIFSAIEAGGYSEGSTAVVFHSSRSKLLATLAHEGWHQYYAAHGQANLPPWLSEGLACYHESISVGHDGVVYASPHHNSFRLNSLRHALRTDQVFSLRDLLNTSITQILSEKQTRIAHAYYAQCWALIAMLSGGNNGFPKDSFDRMIREIATGEFDINVSATVVSRGAQGHTTYAEAVLPTYFGRSVEKLEAPYRNFLYRVAGFAAPKR